MWTYRGNACHIHLVIVFAGQAVFSQVNSEFAVAHAVGGAVDLGLDILRHTRI